MQIKTKKHQFNTDLKLINVANEPFEVSTRFGCRRGMTDIRGPQMTPDLGTQVDL